MKNFRKSRKALSPVVASIILIAVTVAVSIAVAAWMGALSVGFMQNEQMSITNVTFDNNGGVTVDVLNTGTTDIAVTSATVNGEPATLDTIPTTIAKNTPGTVSLSAVDYLSGDNLQIKLMSAKGNFFPYNVVVP